MTDINEQITAKEADIRNYERILSEYYGRWYDQGRRHLAELRQELKALELQRDLGASPDASGELTTP